MEHRALYYSVIKSQFSNYALFYTYPQSLLSMDSAKQRESKKMSDEILQLLSKPTAKVHIN